MDQHLLPPTPCALPERRRRAWLRGGTRGNDTELKARCCQLVFGLCFMVFSAVYGLNRNAGCNPATLANKEPPYGGEILPANVSLVERNQWWPPGQMVDVYSTDEDNKHIGWFYDIHMFFFMRFGYSDVSGQIWFEAQRASWFQLRGQEFVLQRCDVSPNARTGGVFDIVEDYAHEPWCIFSSNCKMFFDVSRRAISGHVSGEHALSGNGATPAACDHADSMCGTACPGDLCRPCIEQHGLSYATYAKNCMSSSNAVQLAEFDSTAGAKKVGRAKFNSTLEWIGGRYKQVWTLELRESDGSVMGVARQRFKNRGMWMKSLSRWSVNTLKEDQYIPNWVVAWLAALDDIDENE